MAKDNITQKIPLGVNFHPADLDSAKIAAAVEGMGVHEFVVLATHEKARNVVSGFEHLRVYNLLQEGRATE